MIMMVSVPERSKGVDSSSTVFALVGSNPTADISFSSSLLHRAARSLCSSLQRVVVLWFCGPFLVSGFWLLASCSSSLLLGPAWDQPARCLARAQEMMWTFERLRLKTPLRLRGVVARSLVFVSTPGVGGARHSRRRHVRAVVRPRVPPPSVQAFKHPSVQVWRMWRMVSVWRRVAAGVVWMSRIGVCVCGCDARCVCWECVGCGVCVVCVVRCSVVCGVCVCV